MESEEDIVTLSNLLIKDMRHYIKPRPTFKTLAISQLYVRLLELGDIEHTMCDTYYAAIKYKLPLDIKGLAELDGMLYSTEQFYPMYVTVKKHGPCIVLLELSDYPPTNRTRK